MATINVDSDGGAHERQEIVPGVSITHLLQQREAVLARFRQASALLREALEIAQQSNLGFPAVTVAASLGAQGHSLVGPYANENVLQTVESLVDAGGWAYLMGESGLRSLMSASKRKEFDSAVHNLKSPPLTRESIFATFGALHEARRAMFDEGVIAVFKGLSWQYATNLPQKFGKRIVLQYVGDRWGCGVSSNATDRLDDLVRVFSVMDGKPEPDHRRGIYHTFAPLFAATRGAWPKNFEHEYFRLRLFRNGNGHLTFKRLDLVDDLNQIIAKHFPGALPAPRP